MNEVSMLLVLRGIYLMKYQNQQDNAWHRIYKQASGLLRCRSLMDMCVINRNQSAYFDSTCILYTVPSVMLTDKMGSPINKVLVGVIVAHIFVNTNDLLTVAQKNTAMGEPNCDEAPPNCHGSMLHNVDNINRYFTYNGSYIAFYARYLVNSSSSHPVCSLDPFQAIPFLHENSSMTLLYIYVECSKPGTRIVIRPRMKYIIPHSIYSLWVTNCTIYWKDISVLGQLVVLYAMELFDWEDEFTTGESEYFDACVQLKDEDTMSMERSIAGCTNVGEIVMKSTVGHTVSPVFVRQLWPSLTGLMIERYALGTVDTRALAKAMPVLQTLNLQVIVSEINLVSLDFPWNQEELPAPYFERRSAAYNLQYNEGILGLSPDIIGRGIILIDVILSDGLDVSFNGFLHLVVIDNCNLTSVKAYMFTNLTGVLAISLTNNRITHLDSASFSGLDDLLNIDLSNNLIKSLPQDIFHNVVQLANIVLRRNQLSHIPAELFAKLTYLRQVDFSQNFLASVSDNAFATSSVYYNKFTNIDLSRNNLTDFPLWLLHLPFLEDINLSFNKISFKGVVDTLRRSMNVSKYHLVPAAGHIQTKTINFHHNNFFYFDIPKEEQNSFPLYQFRLLLTGFRLDFGEEVFNCDCSLFQLYRYLSNFDIMDINEVSGSKSTFHYNRNGFGCLQPEELRGKPLLRAPITALGCDEQLPSCPMHCSCWVRSVDRAVKVNCVHQNLTLLPDSIPDRSIALDFSHNRLLDLPNDLPMYFHSLHGLDLSDNHLEHVGGNIFEAKYNFSYLRLHNNDLMTLPKEVQQLPLTVQLMLSGNRLACDCNTLWLKQWLVSRRHQVTDIDEVLCVSGQTHVLTSPILEVPDADFICVRDTHAAIIGLGALAGFLVLLLSIIMVIYKYRGDIKVMLYFKLGWRPFDRRDDSDILDKEFDAFVSYHHQDSEWVRQEILPRLEDGEPRFRLCLHERDFVVGATVADNICTAVDISRRMVLLLSKAFLQSHWCHQEFRQAHYKVMEERTNYLILVLCEDVSVEDLDEEMQPYLRTNTYLRRDSRWFWEKLRYAMPQKTLLELQRDRNLPNNDDWSGVHAIARAQHVESTLMETDQRPNTAIPCGNHHQNRGKQNDHVTRGEMGENIPQATDDIPLVENARNYSNT